MACKRGARDIFRMWTTYGKQAESRRAAWSLSCSVQQSKVNSEVPAMRPSSMCRCERPVKLAFSSGFEIYFCEALETVMGLAHIHDDSLLVCASIELKSTCGIQVARIKNG